MIPSELLFHIEDAGNFGVFVGRDAPAALTGLPSAAALTMKAKPGATSLVAALAGLPAFKQTQLLSEWNKAGAPGSLHTAVAALPTLWFVSTAVDGRLAHALTAEGRTANVLVEDDDFAGRVPGRPYLLKIAGDGARGGSVVVTSDGFESLPDGDSLKLYARLRDWLERMPFILVGCDPTIGSDFDTWEYGHLLEPQGAFGRGAWLVWPAVDAGTRAVWQARGVTVVEAEPVAFLAELKTALGAWTAVDPDVERWRNITNMLREASTPAQIVARVAALPAAELPDTATITIMVDLDDQDRLETAVDITYRPDRGLDYDPNVRASGPTTRDDIAAWAKQSRKDRNNGFQPDEDTARSLFDAIFPAGSERLKNYEAALLLGTQGKTVVRYVIKPAEEQGALWAVPWELLHDGSVSGLAPGAAGRGFVGLGYPVYRWIRAATAVEQATGRVTKALLVAADASQTLTKLDEEAARVKAILEARGVAVTYIPPDDPRLDDPPAIRLLIGQGQFELLHFMGHGQFDPFDPSLSGLKLGRQSNDNVVLPVASLAEAARDDRSLKLVFLSACEVGEAGAQDADRLWEEAGVVTGMVRAGVPTAVGMRWKIEDDASEALVRVFYQALATPGTSIEKAVQLARQELRRQDKVDWTNPILVKKHHSFTGAAGLGADGG